MHTGKRGSMKRAEALITMAEMVPLIREALGDGRSIRIFPRGTSMRPMLRQGIDSVVLSPAPDHLKKYDIPLYRRDNGAYILHRIVGVDTTYSCVGDNQFEKERGIRQDQIVGVVTGFYRGKHFYSMTAPGYRLYCVCWHHTRTLRYLWRRGSGFLRRAL